MPRQSFLHRVAALTPTGDIFYISRAAAERALASGAARTASGSSPGIQLVGLGSVHKVLIPRDCHNFKEEYRDIYAKRKTGRSPNALRQITEAEREFESEKRSKLESPEDYKPSCWPCECGGLVWYSPEYASWYCDRCKQESR